jgi:hypothetical protein
VDNNGGRTGRECLIVCLWGCASYLNDHSTLAHHDRGRIHPTTLVAIYFLWLALYWLFHSVVAGLALGGIGAGVYAGDVCQFQDKPACTTVFSILVYMGV